MSGLTFEHTNVVDWPVPKNVIPGFTYYHSDKTSDLSEQGSNYPCIYLSLDKEDGEIKFWETLFCLLSWVLLYVNWTGNFYGTEVKPVVHSYISW